MEQIRPRTTGHPEGVQLLLGPTRQAGPHMTQQEQARSQPVGAINSCGASKGSANCQHHPWLGQAAAVPLRKLQRGTGVPVLSGAHLPIPKRTFALLSCANVMEKPRQVPAMETPKEHILPEPRTHTHAYCFPEMCSSQNNNRLEQTKITQNHLNCV